MDRHSLGACAEVGLTFNLIVALESIALHVILVEESSLSNWKMIVWSWKNYQTCIYVKNNNDNDNDKEFI